MEETAMSSELLVEESANPGGQPTPHYLRGYAFYLLLFPPNYKVPARRLIALWVAEGLIHPRGEGTKSAEQIAKDYLNDLRDWGFIDVVEEKRRGKLTCSMNPSRRNELMNEANIAGFLLSENGDEIRRLVDCSDYDYNHRCNSYIKIQGNPTTTTTTTESLRNFRYVISFLSFNTREGSKPGEDIGDFIQRCISSGCFDSIRVLDLERVFRPKLPNTLGRLINLKYLGLRWTYLQRLPDSVEELFKLQVLDLKKTYISVLPRSIWRMEFLTHLYLSEAYRTRFPQKPSQFTLTALHTLWGAFIDEDTPVKGGLDRLENVRNLGLSCMPRASIAEETQGQPEAANTSEESLEAVNTSEEPLEAVNTSEEPLEAVNISEEPLEAVNTSEEQPGATNTTEPVKTPMEKQLEAIDTWISYLKDLESLRLKSRDEYNKAASLSLTTLLNNKKLSTLYLLGKLNDGLIMHLPASLTKITLSGSNLQENPLYFLGKLPNLEMLRLLGQSVGCNEMHCSKTSFPKLQLLWIWKLENLEIFDVKEGSMPCLKELEIRNCQRLNDLPRPLLCIPNLEIQVTDMPQSFEDNARRINPVVKIIREIDRTPTSEPHDPPAGNVSLGNELEKRKTSRLTSYRGYESDPI